MTAPSELCPPSVLPLPYRGIDYQSSWTLDRLTDADIEPVTLAEAKANMRVDSSDEDDYHEALITVAREWCEHYTGRALIDQTWQLRFEGYSYGEFRLRRSPVIAIESFFYDVDGVSTEFAAANYVLDGGRTKWPRLLLANGAVWPATYWARPLTIQFRAGFANRVVSPTEGAEKVPAAFKHAIKLIVAFLNENREATPDLTPNVKWLLDPQCCELGIG